MFLFAAINESEKRIQPLQLTLLCLAVIFFKHDKVDGRITRPIIQHRPKINIFMCVEKYVYS